MSYLSNAYLVLNEWISNADSRTYKEQIEANYEKLHEIYGGEVDSKGIFTYEDDPPLEPLMEFHRHEEHLYVYKYSLISIVTPNKTFVTRVD